MAKSDAERQRAYRHRRQVGITKRIDVTLPLEEAGKLDWLKHHWKCSKTEVIRRILDKAWQEAECPVYTADGHLMSEHLGGYDPDNPPPEVLEKQALHDNRQVDLFPDDQPDNTVTEPEAQQSRKGKER